MVTWSLHRLRAEKRETAKAREQRPGAKKEAWRKWWSPRLRSRKLRTGTTCPFRGEGKDRKRSKRLKKNIERRFGALGKELKVDCRSCLRFWISLPEWVVRWIASRMFILLPDKSIVSDITLVTQTIDPVLRYSCTVHLVILAPCQDDAEKVAEPEEKEKDAPKTKGDKLKEPQTTLQQSRSKRWLTWVERERKPLRHLTRLVCTHILLQCFLGVEGRIWRCLQPYTSRRFRPQAATNGLPDTAGARSLSHQWHHHECNLEIKHGEVMSSQFEIPESQIFEIFQLAT